MKRFVYTISSLFVFILLLGGCAQKAQVYVPLSAYTPTAAVLQKSGAIYLAGVTDARKNRSVIGYILKNDKPVTKILTKDSIEKWFASAITEALNAEGCRVLRKPVRNPNVATVRIRIDKLGARLDRGKLTGENLTAAVKVTLSIQQQNTKIVKHIGLIRKKWVPPFSTEETIRDYLQQTLDEVVENVREQIDQYRL